MGKAKKWVLAKKFEGEPKDSNFRLDEEDVPDPKDGEFVCEAVYLSVDPYMRVTESKNKDYPVGTYVQMYAGWRTRCLVDPKTVPEVLRFMKVPDLGKREPSLALGILGMPGMTAYFGFLELCKPKEGDVVLVNGAAGAVGSAVGQIAKIKGCTVIGFAGTKEKCEWVKSLGFDYVYNYREKDVDEALKEAAPKGIDCFFDNVGGEFASKAIQHMKEFGRIAVCGAISTYNDDALPKLPFPFRTILFKQLKVEGFIVYRWGDRFLEGKAQMLKWINEMCGVNTEQRGRGSVNLLLNAAITGGVYWAQGKIKFKETIREGFENMPKTFMALLKGDNTGKMIVKA